MTLQVLVIVAASHLDAVTFQICSQSFKIMPTALFAVWLLGQVLQPMQWASLPVLAVGVVLVTMNGSSGARQLHGGLGCSRGFPQCCGRSFLCSLSTLTQLRLVSRQSAAITKGERGCGWCYSSCA